MKYPEYRQCPKCRGDELEMQWCSVCNKTGLVALLQPRAVKDSLTTQADFRACVNRVRVNWLSQETYCESCVHEGRNWRKDHFLDAAGQRLLEGGE